MRKETASRVKGHMSKKKYQRKDIPDDVVCLACYLFHNIETEDSLNSLGPYGMLCDAYPNYPEKVILSAMERSLNKGLIEYGINLRYAWVTDEGKKLIFTNEGE